MPAHRDDLRRATLLESGLAVDLAVLLAAASVPILGPVRSGAMLEPVAGHGRVPLLGRSDRLLRAIDGIVSDVHTPASPASRRVLATVMFTDIVGSTERAARLGDRRWRELLAAHDDAVRRCVRAHGGSVVKSLGDGHLAVFDAPARALRCSCALAAAAESLGIRLRTGVHTGELESLGHDVAGIAVHIGARVMAMAQPGEVLATSTVRDLVVGSGIGFAHRGEHALVGVPGVWTLLAMARDGSPRPDRPRRRRRGALAVARVAARARASVRARARFA
jgi:class 3 adenylate cyclase